MLYPHKSKAGLDFDLFKNPTSEYRGTPFWAWNCKLNKEILEKQIEYLKEMGLGGFHIHSRTGMATEYLSDEFMDLVKVCVDKAEKEGMLAWLYDEDRWPSGAAGGIVTKDPQYRGRMLVFTPDKIQNTVSRSQAEKSGETYLLACYDIALDGSGSLSEYKAVDEAAPSEAERWYAYVSTVGESPWYNNQTYVDTLNGKAIDRFIEVTYKAYKDSVGDRFGSVIPAIFTDEPQFSRKSTLGFATDKREITLPWTDDIPESFMAQYNFDIVASLPELFWDLPEGKVSRPRYCYHDHIGERFAQAFADKCGKWCDENGIMLTGHLMAEATLESQTAFLGDAMRSFRGFQLPGIDMLCDYIEFNTAKQAQSAARQYGRDGVLSELYGVTNWDFDFRGHKFQGDWQAALGVTVRVHHLSWVSMEGEAKRDYPATMNYQIPWYKEYPYVEDHFARLNTALTRGTPVVNIGVIHPVESYWLHWGPNESTNGIREEKDKHFNDLTSWLLLGQLDFDFISESLLPEQCEKGSAPLAVGKMKYDTIIVPNMETIRESTMLRLEEFKAQGGRLIFIGECPKYVDAVESDKMEALYSRSEKIPFNKIALHKTLEQERIVKVVNTNGTHAENFLYTMRQDNGFKWLFIAQGIKDARVDCPVPQDVKIIIDGEYTPTVYDTINGEVSEIAFNAKQGKTTIETTLYSHDGLLLKLDNKTAAEKKPQVSPKRVDEVIDFKTTVPYTLSEPNVLLLDMAEYAFNDGGFFEKEEILRADKKFRALLGYPSRTLHVAQPWVIEEQGFDNFIRLRFRINSEIGLNAPIFALERAEDAEIRLNGSVVENKIVGYYVDESIKKIALPDIGAGEFTIDVKLPFNERNGAENCYLLGDFNVRVEGTKLTIVAPTEEIGFSSITDQGLAFYGGNITYKTEINLEEAADLAIRVSHYRGAMVKVKLDGNIEKASVYAPYTVAFNDVKQGNHTLEFTLFGNRHNTFGALHNIGISNWYGPGYWRSEGNQWSYEYSLHPTGILASPVIEVLR